MPFSIQIRKVVYVLAYELVPTLDETVGLRHKGQVESVIVRGQVWKFHSTTIGSETSARKLAVKLNFFSFLFIFLDSWVLLPAFSFLP